MREGVSFIEYLSFIVEKGRGVLLLGRGELQLCPALLTCDVLPSPPLPGRSYCMFCTAEHYICRMIGMIHNVPCDSHGRRSRSSEDSRAASNMKYLFMCLGIIW